MESPPKLGLGTINIAPLHEMTNLTTRVWVRSLGMGIITQPHRLPVIVSYVLISLKAHSILLSILTHTHQHTSSNQYGINHPKTLTYIYHGNLYETQHTSIMLYHIISSKATNKQDITRAEIQTWQQGIKIKYNSNI